METGEEFFFSAIVNLHLNLNSLEKLVSFTAIQV
jgi:hypothetical protein